jgi:FtsZ-binding cell division protein ZapB
MIDTIQQMQNEIAFLKAENKEYRRKFDKLKKHFIEIVEERYNNAVARGDNFAQVVRYETFEDAGILDEL